MYEVWYDYVKSKYGENEKRCYIDKDSCIFHLKTNDFYKDIAEDAETRFGTSNFELDRTLPKGKISNWTNEDELGGKMMKEIVGLKAKIYSYFKDKILKIKTEKQKAPYVVIKRKLKFQDYKNCLEADQIAN